jgi:type I restriction enzyme S subunit
MTPSGWQEGVLANVVVPDGLQTGPFGSQLHAADYTDQGVPVVMPKDIRGGRITTETVARVPEQVAAGLSKHRVFSGDILFSRRGDIGRCGLVTEVEQGWLCGTGCLRVRVDHGRGFPPFLIQALSQQTTVQWLTENAVGQTMLNLNTGILARTPMLLPPVPEQRKIAAILSSVDEAIDKTQAVIDQLGVVKKAMMQDLLTKGLPGRHTRFKKTEIGMVPEEWEVVAVADVGPPDRPTAQTGPFGAQLSTSDFVEEGVPVLKIGNVQWGRLELHQLDYVSPAKARELDRFQVRPGDLLFARQGATTGRNALADERCAGWLINYHIIRVATDPNRCLPAHLMTCFNSDLVQMQVGREKGRGNRDGINTANILGFRMPLPPIQEQRAMTKAFTLVDGYRAANQMQLEQLRKLKAALMSVLLTGEVRVTPDEDAA